MNAPDVATLRWVADRLEAEAADGLIMRRRLARGLHTQRQRDRLGAGAAALAMNAARLRDLADDVASKQDPFLGEPFV
jgi:hypothetical protein